MSSQYTLVKKGKNGAYTHYYYSGQIAEKGTQKGNEKLGEIIRYYKNGNVKETGKLIIALINFENSANFTEEIKQGKWKYYNKDGSVLCEIEYYKGLIKNINCGAPSLYRLYTHGIIGEYTSTRRKLSMYSLGMYMDAKLNDTKPIKIKDGGPYTVRKIRYIEK